MDMKELQPEAFHHARDIKARYFGMKTGRPSDRILNLLDLSTQGKTNSLETHVFVPVP
jgi:hypothetical protein